MQKIVLTPIQFPFYHDRTKDICKRKLTAVQYRVHPIFSKAYHLLSVEVLVLNEKFNESTASQERTIVFQYYKI